VWLQLAFPRVLHNGHSARSPSLPTYRCADVREVLAPRVRSCIVRLLSIFFGI
jgi:hypothetical protein